jgi:hypothetical protein
MAVRTTVVAGTAAAVGAHAANSRNAQANAQAASAPAPEPAYASASVPEPAAPDPIAQLTQLAALKDSGALTKAEFDAEKAKILG